MGVGGFETVISPLISVEPCGTLPDMSRYIGVIFTSANGVAAYRALGGPLDKECYVVGAATAAAARDAGLFPLSADGDANALLQFIQGLSATGPLLHLRGRHATGNIAERLNSSGIETEEAVIYDQPLLDLTDSARKALSGTAPVVVPLFSPRSAARFAALRVGRAPLMIAAMSQAVVREVLDLGATTTIVADQPSGEAMRNAVSQLLVSASTLEGGLDAQ